MENVTRSSGIAIEFSTLAVGGVGSNNWRVESNTFDGSYEGVFINANDEITITSNLFTRWGGGASWLTTAHVSSCSRIPSSVKVGCTLQLLTALH